MLCRIQIEQRFDKQKAVIEAVKELTSDFVILTGVAYLNGNHRPCQIIEINDTQFLSIKPRINKLKKILNTPHMPVIRVSNTERILY